MKQSIYIISAVLVFFVILAWIINKYAILKNAEQEYAINLFSLVPSDNNLVFYSENIFDYRKALVNNAYFQRNEKNLPQYGYSFIEKISEYTENGIIPKEITQREILISSKSDDYFPAPLYLFKVEDNEISVIYKLLQKIFFSGYKPIKEKVGEATLHFYPLSGSQFFCCTMLNGYFVGSRNRKQVEKVINPLIIPDNSFMEITTLRSKHIAASVFSRKDTLINQQTETYWSSFDIYINDQNINLIGLSNIPEKSSYIVFNTQKTIPVADLFLPKQTIAILNYALSNYNIFKREKRLPAKEGNLFYLNDSVNNVSYLQNYFNQNTYSIYYKDTSNTVQHIFCIELNDSIKALDAFQETMRQTKSIIATHYKMVQGKNTPILEMIQSGFMEASFGLDFHTNKSKEFITFDGNYLIAGDSIETLVQYIEEIHSPNHKSIYSDIVTEEFEKKSNGLFWVNCYDEDVKYLPSWTILKRILGPVHLSDNCIACIQWNYENERIYQNIIFR